MKKNLTPKSTLYVFLIWAVLLALMVSKAFDGLSKLEDNTTILKGQLNDFTR